LNKKVVLWDEINRSKYDMQNQILQVIRDRRCSGIKVDIHFVFAAMNELHEKGTKALDRALADRFNMIINFPSFSQLKDTKDKLAVINNVTTQDAIMVGGGKNPKPDSALIGLLTQARNEYHSVDCGLDKFVESVVNNLNSNPNRKYLEVSGRRAGMMKRSLQALYAIKRIKEGRKFNPKDEKQLTSMIYYLMIDRVITGEDEKILNVIKVAVSTAIDVLFDSNNPASKYYNIDSPVDMLIEATKDAELRKTENSTYQDIVISALSKSHATSKSGKDIVSPEECALSLFVLANQSSYNKTVIERALTTFNSIENIAFEVQNMTGNGVDVEYMRLQKAIARNISGNNDITNTDKVISNAALKEVTNEDSRNVLRRYISDYAGYLLRDAVKTNEVSTIFKKICVEVSK
jgi:hypothetical protein